MTATSAIAWLWLLMQATPSDFNQRAFGAQAQSEMREAQALILSLKDGRTFGRGRLLEDPAIRRLVVLDYAAWEALTESLSGDPNPLVRASAAYVLSRIDFRDLDTYLESEKHPLVRAFIRTASSPKNCTEELIQGELESLRKDPQSEALAQNALAILTETASLSEAEERERVTRVVRLLGEDGDPGAHSRQSVRAENSLRKNPLYAFGAILDSAQTTTSKPFIVDALWTLNTLMEDAERAAINGNPEILRGFALKRLTDFVRSSISSADEDVRQAALKAAVSLVYAGEESLVEEVKLIANGDSSEYLRKKAGEFLAENWKESDFRQKLMRALSASERTSKMPPTSANRLTETSATRISPPVESQVHDATSDQDRGTALPKILAGAIVVLVLVVALIVGLRRAVRHG